MSGEQVDQVNTAPGSVPPYHDGQCHRRLVRKGSRLHDLEGIQLALISCSVGTRNRPWPSWTFYVACMGVRRRAAGNAIRTPPHVSWYLSSAIVRFSSSLMHRLLTIELPTPVSMTQVSASHSRRSTAQVFMLVNCILLMNAVGIIGLACALHQVPSPWHFQSAMLNMLVLIILRLSRLLPEANNGEILNSCIIFQLRSAFFRPDT